MRANIDGELAELAEPPKLDPEQPHTIEVFIDRLVQKDGIRQRLTDSIELAAKLTGGLVKISPLEGEDILFSEKFACPTCGTTFPEITPRLFSFNNPAGACPACDGIGAKMFFDPELIVPDGDLSLRDGAIEPWERRNASFFQQVLEAVATHFEIDLTSPWKKLPEKHRKLILQGSGERRGRVRRSRRTGASTPSRRSSRAWWPTCSGASTNTSAAGASRGAPPTRTSRRSTTSSTATCRSRPARSARARACGWRPATSGWAASRIVEMTALTIRDALDFLKGLTLSPRAERLVAERILREIGQRLSFLVNVGLDYLSLDRPAATLSGGEAQRIRLATQIGSGLMGVLYILDEPQHRPAPARQRPPDLDAGAAARPGQHRCWWSSTTRTPCARPTGSSTWGPRRAKAAGASSPPARPRTSPPTPRASPGAYLSGRKIIEVPRHRRQGGNRGHRPSAGARAHNLRNLNVNFPIGVFTCVTGRVGVGQVEPGGRHPAAAR